MINRKEMYSQKVSLDYDIPVICMKKVLGGDLKESMKVAKSFHKFGVVIVKDERVSDKDNAVFLDTMEQYFEQSQEKKRQDIRPELYYQVGATPSFTEQPKNHCNKIVPGIDRPVTLCPPSKDAKWRFFWRIGKRPPKTQFPELNAEQVIPESFSNTWKSVMDTWGHKLYQSVWDISEALAVGLNMPAHHFQQYMLYGPHLLAPTGTDLQKFGKLGTVMAGYHYDLNFITCHGKSRYPGLYIWLRNGKRIPVHIPEGCLLMQAGIQLEWLTGGYIKAGYHEVIVSKDTQAKLIEKEIKKESLWRVSSTFFSHCRSDAWLEPYNDNKNYPKIQVGTQVQNELKNINLKQ